MPQGFIAQLGASAQGIQHGFGGPGYDNDEAVRHFDAGGGLEEQQVFGIEEGRQQGELQRHVGAEQGHHQNEGQQFGARGGQQQGEWRQLYGPGEGITRARGSLATGSRRTLPRSVTNLTEFG